MRHHLLGALFGVTVAGSLFAARDARACGGDFLPPTETETVTTDHRMILSISSQQTTLYDQIEYHGSPASFAWVLPIKGTVTVGLSADILFDTLDSLTATQVVQPSPDCPAPPTCGEFFGPEANGAAFSADAGAAGGGVTVTAQAQVGPYETVQLHSTDGSALTNWLATNGFSVPSSAAPVIAAYVAQQFDFLAMKLIPGEGVEAMQPVRVTSEGSAAVLPMRMVSVGTGATTGITLWVVADARWEPQSSPFFTITDSELAWDWTTNSSNYDTLRLSKEAALGGAGWQIESSLDLSQDAVTSGVTQNVAVGGPSLAGGYAAAVDGGPPPVQQDLGVLLSGIDGGGSVRITRMRGDMAHSALAASDLTLQLSSDQSAMSNLYNPAKQTGEPLCPVYNDSCSVIGSAPRDQATVASSTGGGGCNAAPSTSGTPATLAGLAGLLGLVVAQARRRRRSGR